MIPYAVSDPLTVNGNSRPSAYWLKATVQAAIGAVPLAATKAAGMDSAPGEVILAVAVLSIVLTTPAGAWAIATLGKRLRDVEAEAEAKKRPERYSPGRFVGGARIHVGHCREVPRFCVR